jgi:hypothetical protein
MALVSPVRDGRAWFGGLIPLPLNPNLGTISTMPPDRYKRPTPAFYGGDQGGAVHFVGVGPGVEKATEDAARRAVD